MLGRLIMVVCAVAITIVGLTVYLAPDDIASCVRPSSDVCASADAIVVISGGDTEARTSEAVRLYHAGWAPLVVVSGAAADKTGPSNAETMRQQAIRQGVPRTQLITEGNSETTKQNASEVARLVTEKRIRSILLVTSGYHMQRARLEFTATLPQVKIRSHPVAMDRNWSWSWWLTPWGWRLAFEELMKIGAFYTGGSR